jgi:hypothetical protein
MRVQLAWSASAEKCEFELVLEAMDIVQAAVHVAAAGAIGVGLALWDHHFDVIFPFISCMCL